MVRIARSFLLGLALFWPGFGMPLRFEANAGQADPEIQFTAWNGAGSVLLRAQGAILKARGAPPVRVNLAGAIAPAAPEPMEPLASHSNYFIGRDPSKW